MEGNDNRVETVRICRPRAVGKTSFEDVKLVADLLRSRKYGPQMKRELARGELTDFTPTIADLGDDDSPKIYKPWQAHDGSATQLTEVPTEVVDDRSRGPEMALMNYLREEMQKSGTNLKKGRSKYTRKRGKRK